MLEDDCRREIGRRIRCLRKQNELTQLTLGKRIRRSRVTIVNWEAGRNSPNPWQLVCLGSALGVSPEEFLVPISQFWDFYG